MTNRGEAGRWGDDVRSDTFVAVELTGSGGLTVELESKVEAYFGDAIRVQARQLFAALGVEDARIQIQDAGAVPFVLAARLEAAARAAGVTKGDARPDCLEVGEASERHRLRRSRLYLPGNQPKFMLNAGLFSPDGVILDLEDSVHPQAKPEARLLVRNALRCLDFRDSERMVRINQLPLGFDDLDAVVPEAPDVILIPKVDEAEQVREVDARIAEIRGGRERNLWLMPIVESALGVENAFAIATASKRVCALTIGLEDYTSDLGVEKTKGGTESLFARCRVVNAARAAGVQAIDSVFADVADMDGLRAWAAASRALGFEGMGCIHPRQISVIHEAFAPTKAETDEALRIVRAFEEAEARGLGVVSLGSKMIDSPVVERARRLVHRARSMGIGEGF